MKMNNYNKIQRKISMKLHMNKLSKLLRRLSKTIEKNSKLN